MVRQAFVLRIAALCWAHDPIDLAVIGAPPDEYMPEARTIIERVPEARDEDDMVRIVAEEFAHWFTPEIAGPQDNYRSLGGAIWHLVHAHADTAGSDA